MLISKPAHCPVCLQRVRYTVDEDRLRCLPADERQALVTHTIAGHDKACAAEHARREPAA